MDAILPCKNPLFHSFLRVTSRSLHMVIVPPTDVGQDLIAPLHCARAILGQPPQRSTAEQCQGGSAATQAMQNPPCSLRNLAQLRVRSFSRLRRSAPRSSAAAQAIRSCRSPSVRLTRRTLKTATFLPLLNLHQVGAKPSLQHANGRFESSRFRLQDH